MTFQLGKQKLVKNNQDNQIRRITLRNMYFLKKHMQCTTGAEEFSRIFVLKVTLQSVRLLLTVTEKLGEQAVLVPPPIILLGEQLLSLLPGSRAYGPAIRISSAYLQIVPRNAFILRRHVHQLDVRIHQRRNCRLSQ